MELRWGLGEGFHSLTPTRTHARTHTNTHTHAHTHAHTHTHIHTHTNQAHTKKSRGLPTDDPKPQPQPPNCPTSGDTGRQIRKCILPCPESGHGTVSGLKTRVLIFTFTVKTLGLFSKRRGEAARRWSVHIPGVSVSGVGFRVQGHLD